MHSRIASGTLDARKNSRYEDCIEGVVYQSRQESHDELCEELGIDAKADESV